MSDEIPAGLPGDRESHQAPRAAQGFAESEQVDAPKLVPRATARRRRRWSCRRHWPIVVLIGAIVGGWILYALVWPPLEIRQKILTTKWKYSPSDPEISIPIRIMLRTCEYWFVFWFFYLGASIGSFINVVASRTPRGKTIVSRGSHCPFCDQPLRMIDNSPLFGWVALRGRCRTCHLPISPRYLTMEILVGLMFTILAIVELMGNGMNLPHRDWKYGSGIVSTVFYPKWDLIGAYVAHCSLFATAVMLIASHMDRLRFPVVPLVVLAAIYLASVSVNPVLCPVRWTEPWGAPFPSYGGVPWDRFLTGAIGGAFGLVLGGMLAAVIGWYFVRHHPEARPGTFVTWIHHSTLLMALAGILLGWQGVLNVGLLAFAITSLALAYLPVKEWNWLSKEPDLRPQVLALVIWTSTLFFHHCVWRYVAFLSLLPFRPGN